MLHRQMPVEMIVGFGVVRAPAVRPDLRRAQQLPARAENDADRLFVENEWEAGHYEPVASCGMLRCLSKTFATRLIRQRGLRQRVNEVGRGGVGYSDTFTAVSS